MTDPNSTRTTTPIAYLECRDGTSHKWYRATLVEKADGSFAALTEWGPIGRVGGTLEIGGPDRESALAQAAKKLIEKRKQYLDVPDPRAGAGSAGAGTGAVGGAVAGAGSSGASAAARAAAATAAGAGPVIEDPNDWRTWIPAEARALVKPAFLPVTEKRPFGDRSGFGGAPYLPAGIEHPVCPVCHHAMTHFVQLRIEDLPERARPKGTGLLQLFYCTSEQPDLCEASMGAWEPFSAGAYARIVPASGGSISGVAPVFPPVAIVGWTEKPDLPNWEELGNFDVELDDALSDRLADGDVPLVGDKLGGWPAWVQGVEYPACRLCSETMDLVFQVDSEDHVPFMFGDVGTGHITQCPKHPEILAFGWACS